MILSAQSIRSKVAIAPFKERTVIHGMSYGLSAAGYDIRVKLPDGVGEAAIPPHAFTLVTTIERFAFPNDVMGMLCDKSTWARRGLAVQNTVFEPGWCGYPTLELSNHSDRMIFIQSGMPIAQMIFHMLDQPTDRPYSGKYQDQIQEPVLAKEEA